MLETAAKEAGFPDTGGNSIPGVTTAAAPYRVFYSRKNFLFPTRQQGPHRSWRDEVSFLDRLFIGGSAYMIGKMNGEHWYLYITEPHTQLTPPRSPVDESSLPRTETKFLNVPPNLMNEEPESEEDETLEILMTDLDEKLARQYYLEDASAVASGQYLHQAQDARKDAFRSLGSMESAGKVNTVVSDDATFDVFGQTSSDNSDVSGTSDDEITLPEELSTEGHALGTIVSEICGLSAVYPTSEYPDARIDAYLFNPCGFSANGIIPAPHENSPNGTPKSGHYFTMHVTPEPQCSYASFETNVPMRQTGRQTAELVEEVVKIFRPGRFSVTMFEASNQTEQGPGIAMTRKTRTLENIAGYKRVERIVHDLDGYELVFRYYERLDWKGGAPILGEKMFP